MKKIDLQVFRKFKEIRKNRSLATFNRINTELAPLREAKKATIHTLAGIGNQHKVLRYPILAFLFIFIFLYNFFYYTLLKFRVHEKVARAISFILVIALILDGIYVPVAAYNRAENGEEIEEMCLNHPFHDEFCGYVEAVEGQPCNHVHTEDCYLTTEFCLHLHDDSCYEMQNVLICGEEEREASFDVSANEEYPGHIHTEECYELQEVLICDHVCSEENGCIKVELNCQHVHDEECGYVAAVEGQPCMHTCELCDGSLDVVETDDVSGNDFAEEVEEPVSEEIEEVEETEETEEAEVAEIPFSASQTIGNVEILVSAPFGVFPEGATLRAAQIVNQKAEAIENLVNEIVDANGAKDEITTVEETYSFDIEILDAEGNVCEPDLSKGQVNVEFKNVGAANAEIAEDKSVTVFYVDDEIANVEEIESSVNVEEDSAVFEAEHFSIYTVVITSGIKKDTYLHYYQGSSKANSHFTIYNETQLVKYRDLYNAYVAGTVSASDSIATILVNSDDANPMEGITELGQAADLVVGDLNFAAAIMDDIVVNSQWTPIASVPVRTVLEGYGHTVTLKSLVSGTYNWGNAAKESNAFVSSVLGTINNLTVIGPDGDNTKIVYSSDPELEDDTEYATLTIRVDGEKVDIGKAITGAETLAVSCDGENYITLERYDDWAVYRTPLDNLEEGVDYTVYYVYEDENETISQSTIRRPTGEELLENPSREGEYQIELDYVSVTYDLMGANTYKKVIGADGKEELTKNVMASVRVDVMEDGSYRAKEAYDAVLVAVDGYAIPTRTKNVIVKINGIGLVSGTDYSYTYNEANKTGEIVIEKEKINGPISVKVQADSLEDSPLILLF